MKREHSSFLFALVFAGVLSVLFLSSSFINIALALPSPSVLPTAQGSMYISWSDPYGAEWFNIYRCTGASCTPTYYTQVYSTGYTNSGLTCGTTYGYYITSDYGSSVTVYGTTDVCTPGAPSALSGSASSQSSVTISWTRNAPYTDTGIRPMFKQTSPAVWYAGALMPAGSTSGDVTGLSCNNNTGIASAQAQVVTNGRTYFSAEGNGASSFTTDACTPAAPTMTSAATVNQSQIITYFTDNSSNETGFYIMTSGGSQVGSSGAIGGTGSPTSGYGTSLSCNTSYYLYADAYVNTNGRTYRGSSAWSNLVTTDQCTPGQSTIGSASATGQTTATVNWTRNSPLTDTGTNIYDQVNTLRGTTGAAASSGGATGLSCGTSYQFKTVPFVDTNGRSYWPAESVLSNSITTTACNTAPNTPINVSPPNGSWTTSRQFCATVSDPNGGTVSARFFITPNTYVGSTVTSGSDSCYPHTADLNGAGWYAYATDGSLNSGNSATWTAKIDTVNPTPGTTWTPSSGTWHNTLTGTTFTLTGSSDVLSGMAAPSYACTTAGTNGATCTVTVYDVAGNSAVSAASPANNVDTTNPTTSVPLSANPSGWTTSASVAITGTVSDAGGSGVAGYYYKCTAGGSYIYAAGSSISFSCSTAGGQTAYAYGVDGATNTNSASPSSVAYYIDTAAPTANITGNTVNEASAMTLDSNGADTGGSNVASYAWYSGTLCSGTVLGSSATYAAGTQNEPYSANYAVKVTDGAGNFVCATATATWNNVAPTASASVSPNPSCNGDPATWTAVGSDLGGTTFSYQWYSDGSCSSIIGGATNSTRVDTAVYSSTTRSVIVKDAQGAPASCAPSTNTVNSCVVAPTAPASTVSFPDAGRPQTTLSWSTSANGYRIWKYPTTVASSSRALAASTALSSYLVGSLACPAGYTFEIVAYNTDPSVVGTDPSCDICKSTPNCNNWSITGAKCSLTTVLNTKVDFCTKLFLNQ